MTYTKTIICFANSRKNSGRCIAGKEYNESGSGQWMRPVSERLGHEISESERSYQDGSDPQLFDIIRIHCKYPNPVSHQNENHVIEPQYYWKKEGNITWGQIGDWLDHPPNLWGVGDGSYAGINNRVAVGQENGTSLYLVAVQKMQLIVGAKAPRYNPKRSVQAEFTYSGIVYRLDVTDPLIEEYFLAQKDFHCEIKNPVLCISLGDLHQTPGKLESYFYKLVAAVIFE